MTPMTTLDDWAQCPLPDCAHEIYRASLTWQQYMAAIEAHRDRDHPNERALTFAHMSKSLQVLRHPRWQFRVEPGPGEKTSWVMLGPTHDDLEDEERAAVNHLTGPRQHVSISDNGERTRLVYWQVEPWEPGVVLDESPA